MYRHSIPSQATETFGITTVILTQPHLVSVVRSKVLMFISNVAYWQLVRGGGGGGGINKKKPPPAPPPPDHSNKTPTGQRKMWENTKSWFENLNENLVPQPICTFFRLIPLSLEVCLQKIFPLKWKGKKRGGGATKPKSQGVTFKPQNNQFFLLSMHDLPKLFFKTTDRAELDWLTRFWAVFTVLARWSENGLTTCSQSNSVLF